MRRSSKDVAADIAQLEKEKARLEQLEAMKKASRKIPLLHVLRMYERISSKQTAVTAELGRNMSYGGPDPDPSGTAGLEAGAKVLLWVLDTLAEQCFMSREELEWILRRIPNKGK